MLVLQRLERTILENPRTPMENATVAMMKAVGYALIYVKRIRVTDECHN
jgi:hypothetical protein